MTAKLMRATLEPVIAYGFFTMRKEGKKNATLDKLPQYFSE